MASTVSEVRTPSDASPLAVPEARLARIRRWAAVGIAAQVLFVASWLVAASWQGPRYSALRYSISDMYARTAPHGMFLVLVFTVCGAATILFALLSVWPALRPGGRTALIGSIMLALSVAGLGDLLSSAERLACRASDPGCTGAKALSNSGGKLDSALTAIGLLTLVLAAFFLAHAMQRIQSWSTWARPTRGAAVMILVFGVASAANSGMSGLFERLFAATAAASMATLAVGIVRQSRDMEAPNPERSISSGLVNPRNLNR